MPSKKKKKKKKEEEVLFTGAWNSLLRCNKWGWRFMRYFILMNVGSPLILTDYSLQNWALVHSSDRIFSCCHIHTSNGAFQFCSHQYLIPKGQVAGGWSWSVTFINADVTNAVSWISNFLFTLSEWCLVKGKTLLSIRYTRERKVHSSKADTYIFLPLTDSLPKFIQDVIFFCLRDAWMLWRAVIHQ